MSKFDNNQLSLNDNGEILWQSVKNNPLPGVPVAKIVKGDALFEPNVALLEAEWESDDLKAASEKHLNRWINQYITEKLELLTALDDANLTGAPAEICKKLHAAMGVVPRAELEDQIAALDEQGRSQLRFKKIRLGPILAFIPLLNKPAAIRLRAILWAIWHGHDLPVQLPADGIVSENIEGKQIDKDLYQMIGYPVYGPRAMRIDMLDRVVVDIYDSSKDWKFQAKHQYCEWLGCTIEDLYKILEALGHKRIVSEEKAPEERVGAEKEESAEEASSGEKAEGGAGLPGLDMFELRRGKMSGKAKEKPKFSKPKAKKPKKSDKAKGKLKGKSKPQAPKSITVSIKGDQDDSSDSPFAVLEQLKNK